VYLFIAPLFWGEIKARPLNYSLGTKFRHLVVKIALLFVLSIIFPNLLSSPLLHFFLSVYPWLTKVDRVRSMILFLDCESVIVITIRYIFCSNG